MRMRGLFAVTMLGSALMFGAASADEVAQAELVRRIFLGGRVSMLVPRDSQVFSVAEIRRSHPGSDLPDLVITDRGRAISITLKHTALPMKPGGLREVLDRLREGLPKHQPKARIIRMAMANWGGRSFMLAFLERPAPSPQGGRRIDNYTVGTVLRGGLLLIAFNSDVAKRPVWSAARDRMIRSIRVHE